MVAKLKNLMSAGPPDLGPGPRPGTTTEKALNQSLDDLLVGPNLPPVQRQLIRALILLWHDHLDSAHVMALEIENPDGSLLHAIVHRRERDYSNALFWLRRAGRHPAYPEIARRAAFFLDTTENQSLRVKLLADAEWSALAFVGLCKQVAGNENAQTMTLSEIQRLESEALLEHFCR